MSELDEQILEELRLTNRLLARLLTRDRASQTERILDLTQAGCSTAEIASMLSLSSSYVAASLAMSRKTGSRKSANKKALVNDEGKSTA